jgi:hypothetical protein
MQCTYTYKNKVYDNIDELKIAVGAEKTNEYNKQDEKYFRPMYERLAGGGQVIAHEYAHFYIRRFINTPIVKEAIAKYTAEGMTAAQGEEALVQAIGEQSVKQEGDAWNWWVAFSRWIKNIFNNLSELNKEELKNILTDAFLTNQDLNTVDYGSSESRSTIDERFPTEREISTELKNQIINGTVFVPRRAAEGKVERDRYEFRHGSWINFGDDGMDTELSPDDFVKLYNKSSDPSWRLNKE